MKEYLVTEYLEKQSIACAVSAQNWEEASRQAAQILIDKGAIRSEYLTRMMEKLEKERSYMVLTSGVAVIHARPGEDVCKNSISLLTLKQPVEFGNANYDPVSVVFMLAATDDNSHIRLMMAVAQKLSQPDIKEKMLAAKEIEELWTLMQD
ncbi:MAG: PTS sugar transporter subunit IIA [Negativibacillus massiliensis]|uniref:PTS sugar transporter subunit IIA n=1 Tax=Negativibacillus massiliensis TaxID=1871035 RepID=UPI00033AD37A|nr:PTS sugar transporter subunit IIA [Negativibacillus massiliensis]MDY4046520.1 PTS sugar transporter subunit IIA [Negativibacillus massiliensis]CDA78287.1 phosphoenolpyruvate-dependent sugar phosphotransferase system EIIA 2 [Clostridium sp. CAG:242]